MPPVNPPMVTISSLRFIKPADLAASLRQQSQSDSSSVAIIDVRDNDHVGGHIRGSQWIPAHQLDANIPELLRTNKDKERVVFHCMLSQQRGPKAALTYARAKAYAAEKARVEEGNVQGEAEKIKDGSGQIGGQEICVLEGGFENWQAFYGKDEALTEKYAADLWT